MKIVSAALVILSFTLPGAALADPGKAKGNGKQAAHASGHANPAVARGDNRQWNAPIAVANGTPPGLAKKPYGMPPGQAKKVWSRGERLPNQYYTQSQYYVTNPVALNLAPAPYGSRWVRVGDNYYLAQTQTGVVSQMISALLR